MKDPLGMMEDSLGSIILLKKFFGDDSILRRRLDEGVACWGFFDGMSFIRELPSIGE